MATTKAKTEEKGTAASGNTTSVVTKADTPKEEYYVKSNYPEGVALFAVIKGEKVNMMGEETSEMTRPSKFSPSRKVTIPAATQEQLAIAYKLGYTYVKKRTVQ